MGPLPSKMRNLSPEYLRSFQQTKKLIAREKARRYSRWNKNQEGPENALGRDPREKGLESFEGRCAG